MTPREVVGWSSALIALLICFGLFVWFVLGWR